jgi:hypothetical protein
VPGEFSGSVRYESLRYPDIVREINQRLSCIFSLHHWHHSSEQLPLRIHIGGACVSEFRFDF